MGEFELKEDIKVIHFSRETYDVFKSAEDEYLEKLVAEISFIDKLEEELSKPIRKHDSELDYLPTQYISELVKSMGFDGIEFKSSLYPKGYNIAIFCPEKFKCIESKSYYIEKIRLSYN